jgi:hypothetical protein
MKAKMKLSPTWRIPIPHYGNHPIDWMEAIDIKRQNIGMELDILSGITGLRGEALAHYCEQEAYNRVAALIRSPLFQASSEP